MATCLTAYRYIIGTDEKLRYYNDAYLACTGSTREYVNSDKRLVNLVHPDDEDRIYRLWKSALRDKQPFTVEYRMREAWRSVDTVTGKDIVGETW